MNRKPEQIPTHEKRVHPRLWLDLKKSIEIHHTRTAPVFDVSRGGACFLSDTKLRIGTEVTVGSGILQIQAQVLDCSSLEPQQQAGEEMFRVRCKFLTMDGVAAETFLEMVVK